MNCGAVIIWKYSSLNDDADPATDDDADDADDADADDDDDDDVDDVDDFNLQYSVFFWLCFASSVILLASYLSLAI